MYCRYTNSERGETPERFVCRKLTRRGDFPFLETKFRRVYLKKRKKKRSSILIILRITIIIYVYAKTRASSQLNKKKQIAQNTHGPRAKVDYVHDERKIERTTV